MKALKFSIFVALFFGFFAALLAMVKNSNDWKNVVIVFALGFAFGFIGAPEIKPKFYAQPSMYQVGGGFLAGLTLGCFFDLNVENSVYSALLGGVLGWLAPYWIKRVSFP